MLSAEAPLFAPADQDGVFALSQGLWAHRESDCTVDPSTSAPGQTDCLDWARITRDADGAWRVVFLGGEDPPTRFIVMPAVRADEGQMARLYVAEGTTRKEPAPNYALIVPRGSLDTPVRRLAVHPIACAPLLTEGEPADITFTREDGRVTGCVAKTKAAVRDAARRSAFDALTEIGEDELVWVR